MPITNSDILKTYTQVFASGPGYNTPFYNRERSKQEISERFQHLSQLQGTAYFVSAPLGTGKTFFIDQITKELGNLGSEKGLILRYITGKDLKKIKREILFVDDADIKTSWDELKEKLTLIRDHIIQTGQTALILGDYCLKNPQLADIFPHKEYLNHFEPLDKGFLKGVIRQRLEYYNKIRNPDDIIDEALYDLLVPDELAPVSSFRNVLTLLERFTKLLPSNRNACQITVDLGIQWVQREFDLQIDTDQQERFLNLLLEFIAHNHPGGSGLNLGFSTGTLFGMGKKVGYSSLEEFNDNIIIPFTRNELLIGKGIPFCNPKGEFIRRPEPFYPSIPLLLLSKL